jgi:hypothetical protein
LAARDEKEATWKAYPMRDPGQIAQLEQAMAKLGF